MVSCIYQDQRGKGGNTTGMGEGRGIVYVGHTLTLVRYHGTLTRFVTLWHMPTKQSNKSSMIAVNNKLSTHKARIDWMCVCVCVWESTVFASVCDCCNNSNQFQSYFGIPRLLKSLFWDEESSSELNYLNQEKGGGVVTESQWEGD